MSNPVQDGFRNVVFKVLNTPMLYQRHSSTEMSLGSCLPSCITDQSLVKSAGLPREKEIELYLVHLEKQNRHNHFIVRAVSWD
jgi:hypothetical protein